MLRIFGIVAAFCFVCFLGVVSANAAAVQWPASAGGNDHWYEAIYADQPVSPNGYRVVVGITVADYSGGITWTAARDAATAKGGWLTDITSEAENTFVYNLIARNQHPRFWFPETPWPNCQLGPWIGGFQPAGSPEPGGNWQWVTGSQFTDANGSPIEYTNWYPGLPTDVYQVVGGGIPEDALHFYERTNEGVPAGKWNDFPSWVPTNGYIVESVPEPSAFVLLGMGAIGLIAFAWRKRNG
jgi:hypothetical protein